MDADGSGEHRNWFGTVRDFTIRLVKVRGVSPGADENEVARAVVELLREDDLEARYLDCGLDPLPGDPYGRHNVYALVPGESRRTVVLCGHFDTVGTEDYGPLEHLATDPDALTAYIAARPGDMGHEPELLNDITALPQEWLFGRGVADMKSGVAAAIAVTRQAALAPSSPLTILFLATPDEENESAGMIAAVQLLHRLRAQYGLEYVAAINTDYTSARYPGDPYRYIYRGTVGKLLPACFVVGSAAHAGEPFAGVDANLVLAELVREIALDVELCDAADGAVTPPPITLHAADRKERYDTQLPFTASVYFNVLTLTSSPGQLLDRLQARAQRALESVLARLDQREAVWAARAGISAGGARSGLVLTYAELMQAAVNRVGEAQVETQLAAEWERWPAETDKRERSIHLVERLWALAGLPGPAIVLYYAPPYYPHVAPGTGLLDRVLVELAAAHPEHSLKAAGYFPLLSDMSWLQLDPGTDVTPLRVNMPVWREAGAEVAGAYSVPFDAIAALNIPVCNIGPYGRAVHQRSERVLMSYSFGVVPALIWETIERLAQACTEVPAAPAHVVAGGKK